MSVYPERRKGRLTGKWIGETDVNGTRVRKRFNTKYDGDKWEGFMKLGSPLEPEKPKGPTLGDVAREMHEVKPSRDRSAQARLMVLLDYFGEGTPLSAIDESRLDKLIRDLRKRHGKSEETLTPGTLNRYLSALSSVFHFARVRKYTNVTLTLPWQKDGGKRLDWLSEDQEAALVEFMRQAGKPAHALMVRVLTATGMRWGELAGLTPEQVEPDAGWIRLWKTKNNTARSAPIPKELAAELKALLSGPGLTKYSTFRDSLKAAAKSAGLPETFSIHALRHTTATRLLQRGVPLAIVQRYLGHKNIQTTLKYTHVADDDLQKALEKLSPRAG